MHPLILLLWYYICGGRGSEIVTFVRDQLYAELTHYPDNLSAPHLSVAKLRHDTSLEVANKRSQTW